MPRSSPGSDERVGLDTPNNYKKLEEESPEQGKMTERDAWEIVLSLTRTFINWKDKTLNNGNYPSNYPSKGWNTGAIQLKEHYLTSDVSWLPYFSEQISPRFRHMEIPYVRCKWLPICSTTVCCSVTLAGWASLPSLMHMSRASAQQQNPKPSEDATESESFLEGCWHTPLGISGRCWYTALSFA